MIVAQSPNNAPVAVLDTKLPWTTNVSQIVNQTNSLTVTVVTIVLPVALLVPLTVT